MSGSRPVYLRSLRERRGFTQIQLAAKSGLPQAHISKLERLTMRRGPTFDTVVALATALGVEPGRLRFGPDPTPIRRPRAVARVSAPEPGARV